MTSVLSDMIIDATENLYQTGILGLVLLDKDFNIVDSHGILVDWIDVGSPAVEVFPFLIGYDDEFEEIKSRKRESLLLPNVSFMADTSHGQKVFSIHLTARPSDDGLALLVQDATSVAAMEQKILQQRNELALAERALKKAKAAAEEANLEKSRFLTQMSHDLKTPMNAILGFSQLLETDMNIPLAPEHMECIGHIHRAGNHLLDIINGILDLARIESGKVSLNIQNLSIREILNDCLPIAKTLGEKRNIELIDNTRGRNFPLVRSDRTRLIQILLNFLSNGIKYNREGGSVVIDSHSTAMGKLRISVSDTGKGIAKHLFASIFQPFNRLGEENSMTEGTGVGLAIAKLLAERMEGEVGFESKVGEGSTFWIDLPVAGD
ncbi:MAG: HAMP domain-containing histidine kinase [Rhodospirillales bacterium]|nr:HAMP domain-containing histidine kinase [Rhodospirillales bacterium]